MKLARKRLLGYRTRCLPKKSYNLILYTINRLIGKIEMPRQILAYPIWNLKAGETVRVRSWEEIQTTLEKRNNIKGHGFMLEMKQ